MSKKQKHSSKKNHSKRPSGPAGSRPPGKGKRAGAKFEGQPGTRSDGRPDARPGIKPGTRPEIKIKARSDADAGPRAGSRPGSFGPKAGFKSDPREDRPRFSFVDRSGKVHGSGNSGKSQSTSHSVLRSPHEHRDSKDSRGSRGARKTPSPSGAGPGIVRSGPASRSAPRREERVSKKYKATIDKNRKGFGFLIFENKELEDAFVPPRDADRFFHGDRVEVSVDSSDEVVGIDVIAHRFRELVGRFTPHPMGIERGGWVAYEQKRAREEVFIPEISREFASKLEPEYWVRVKLDFHEQGQYQVTGQLVEVFGKELPPSADVGMIAAEFNLIEAHSDASEQEAREKKLEIPGRDLEGREDLRSVPFITIDGETARDFDDAIYVERDKGSYILWVAIADVSHYVSEGSELDRDARSRGTSVYFPERAFHMLPRALSENLCSLKPDEPRLTLVAKMFFDGAGLIQLKKTEIMEAVIQSKRRATYNEIQAEWEAQGKNRDWEYAPHFELYQLLRKVRQERGSIDFDLPEAELKVKPTGEVISIRERPRIEAHRLIEEFMIAANESVTEWALARNWPFVYRVHEEPASDSLDKFAKLAATVGVNLSIENSRSPKAIADVVRKLEGHPAQFLLNMALLRSMRQAVYSSVHGIHYGLASQAYTHFTSPIRRYPDLVVHRMLRRALRTDKKLEKPLTPEQREGIEKELVDVTEHCSYRERLASDAERESIKLKQVREIYPHLGEDFEGKIVGLIETGMFCKLLDPYCEGMISKELMTDDTYQFNEERLTYVGRRKKRTFKIGDPVKVKVAKADVERRQIDFALADAEPVGNKHRVDRRSSS